MYNYTFYIPFVVIVCRFEKMISGMYMGEIVRLAIVDLANQNKLFEGRLSEEMKTKGAFGTSFVSDIERYILLKY